MANNRIIYQSEALYVSKDYNSTTEADHKQLARVQSANYSFTVPRTDINQYGVLSRIGTLNTETPTVSVDLSYYITDGFNERALGFYVTENGEAFESGFGGEHLETDTGRNIYILTVPEGRDAVGINSNTDVSVIGIGNAFVSDYTLDLSVGSIPTATVSLEGQNIISDNNVTIGGGNIIQGITNAGIKPSDGSATFGSITLPAPNSLTGTNIPIALRPGDVTVSFSSDYQGGAGKDNGALVAITGDNDGAHIQSLSLSLPLSRTALEKLGSRFAYARAVDFPVNATLTINAIVNSQADQALSELINDTSTFNITASIKKPGSEDIAIKYTFKGCQLQDEAYSSSIGANKSVDLTFTTQIGGPTDEDNNILVSGTFATVPFS